MLRDEVHDGKRAFCGRRGATVGADDADDEPDPAAWDEEEEVEADGGDAAAVAAGAARRGVVGDPRPRAVPSEDDELDHQRREELRGKLRHIVDQKLDTFGLAEPPGGDDGKPAGKRRRRGRRRSLKGGGSGESEM